MRYIELSGINNYIKTNTCSTIIEIDSTSLASIITIIELLLPIKELQIEYIYHDNNILYCSKKYLNNLNKTLHNKSTLIKKLEDNSAIQQSNPLLYRIVQTILPNNELYLNLIRCLDVNNNL